MADPVAEEMKLRLLKPRGSFGQESADPGILRYRMQISRGERAHVDYGHPRKIPSDGMLGCPDRSPV
jgi:hypothetical protein